MDYDAWNKKKMGENRAHGQGRTRVFLIVPNPVRYLYATLLHIETGL